jgi:hypothetical protein
MLIPKVRDYFVFKESIIKFILEKSDKSRVLAD